MIAVAERVGTPDTTKMGRRWRGPCTYVNEHALLCAVINEKATGIYKRFKRLMERFHSHACNRIADS